jgi:DNA invertase Pin-like site-specific DNA recombinase
MKKIAYYVRVSTRDKQDFQYQIKALDKYVKSTGFKPTEANRIIYKEKESGYKNDRPELERLLIDIQSNHSLYDCVYVTEISRLGRNSKTVRYALEIFKECETNLHIKQLGISLLDSNGKVNAYGNIVLSIFIELSDAEARTFKERSIDGIRAGVMDGHAGGGRFLPYGYSKQGKMLVVDPSEARVVRMIFNLYKSGLGFKAIAGILNNQAIPTKSQKVLGNKEINSKNGRLAKDVRWSDKTVDDIIANTMHIGQRRYWGGGTKDRKNVTPEIFEMSGPTLLEDTAIFHECMEIRRTKTHKNSLTVYEYLLKDRIVCGKCGRNYFAKFKPTPTGDKVYICSSRLLKSGNCGNVGVNISFIESVLFHEIVQTDSILKYIGNQDKLKQQLELELMQLKNQNETALRRIEQIEKEIQATMELQIEAKVSNSGKRFTRYSTKLEELSQEEVRLESNLEKISIRLVKVEHALKNRTSVETTTKELLQSASNRTKLRAIFLDLINKVVIVSIDKNTVLADVFIQLDGVTLPLTLKVFLDVSGMRLKKKRFAYRAASDIGFELSYEENKLLTDIEFIQRALFTIKDNDGLIPILDVAYVPDNHILTIPTNQKGK